MEIYLKWIHTNEIVKVTYQATILLNYNYSGNEGEFISCSCYIGMRGAMQKRCGMVTCNCRIWMH